MRVFGVSLLLVASMFLGIGNLAVWSSMVVTVIQWVCLIAAVALVSTVDNSF